MGGEAACRRGLARVQWRFFGCPLDELHITGSLFSFLFFIGHLLGNYQKK
jgi:hypothetical protein